MIHWIIKHANDDCKYRYKENKEFLCEHKENPLLTCNQKYCPLQII